MARPRAAAVNTKLRFGNFLFLGACQALPGVFLHFIGEGEPAKAVIYRLLYGFMLHRSSTTPQAFVLTALGPASTAQR